MNSRILIIEDNATNLELMLYLLRAFKYEADGASDGLSGLEAARTGAYDLILSDIQMPGIDGYELARLLSLSPQRPSLIAVTALAMEGDREKLLAAGFDGYVSKPIDPEAFVRQIESFLHA